MLKYPKVAELLLATHSRKLPPAISTCFAIAPKLIKRAWLETGNAHTIVPRRTERRGKNAQEWSPDSSPPGGLRKMITELILGVISDRRPLGSTKIGFN